MTNFRISIICSAFLVIFLSVSTCLAERFSNIDSMYYWFACQQTGQGVVIAENKDNFTVEEEVLSALVFLSRGQINRAERVLNFFADIQQEQSLKGEFKGFYRYYQANGEPLSSEILTQTQLWLLVAVNEYSEKTGSKKFLPFAKALAGFVLEHEGPECGISAGTWGNTPLTYFTSFDNLMALSAMPKLWKWTEITEYRFAAWRTSRYINKFLWDAQKGVYKKRVFQPDIDFTDNIMAALILGPDFHGWNTFEEPTDLYNRALLALVYTMYKREGRDKVILDDIAKYLIWSKKNVGGCGLPAVPTGQDIDIFVTGWYLLSLKGANPFFIDPSFWQNKVLLPPSERNFKGDDFELGRIKVLLAYPAELAQSNQCQVIVDWDGDDVKTGKGALKIFFNPYTQAKKPEGYVERRFLDTQDFSTAANMKLWIKAFTSVRTMERDLKFMVGFVDADDELWVSPELSLMGKNGFLNSIAFPSGWKRATESVKGNNVFNVERLKLMRFMVSSQSETPWQLFLDDLSFQ